MSLLNARTPSQIAKTFAVLERNTMGNENRKRDGRKTICFRMDLSMLYLLSVLKTFYGYETRNKLMPFMIMSTALEVASLSPKTEWTKTQKQSFKECRKFAAEFGQALAITAAKRVLKKEKPDSKMTVQELSSRIKKELTLQNKKV